MRSVCAQTVLTGIAALSCAALIVMPARGALAGPVRADVRQYAPTGILLRYHFMPGRRIPYQMTLRLSGSIPGLLSTLAVAEQLSFTQQVTTVYPDGSALLVDTFTSATRTVNGQTATVPLSAASVSERVTPEGQVRSATVRGLQTGLAGLGLDPTGGTPTLPTSPVVVGSHWTAHQQISLGSLGTLSGAWHYRVLGLGPANGNTVATISGNGTLPLHLVQGTTQASGTAAGTTAIQFDVEQGTLISEHGTTKVRATLSGLDGAGQGAPFTLTLQLDLVRQS